MPYFGIIFGWVLDKLACVEYVVLDLRDGLVEVIGWSWYFDAIFEA